MTVLDVTAPDGSAPAERPRSGRRASVELVRRCLAGEQEAWAELVRICTPLVWTVARSFGLRPADCEDVCQMTWIRVVENLASLREHEKVATWVATTARRESLRLMSRTDRQVPVGDGSSFDDLADCDVTPEEAALSRADDAMVMAVFRLLPPAHQRLLGMLIADRPRSYDEISAELDMPRGSIGPTRARILRAMRDRLVA